MSNQTTDNHGTPAHGATRRQVLRAGAAATAALAMPAIVRAQPKVLYVNSQGGSWEAAARKNLFDPFTRKTGIEIKSAPGASFAKLALQARTGVYEFDIQTVGAPNVVQAMKQNLLEPINYGIFGRDTVPAGQILEHGVGNHAYSTNICFNTTRYAPGSIKTWQDFWNVGKFPGPRSLGRELSQTIVFALLADGVPRDKLYPIDLDRAFRSLDKIKQSTRVWWTTGPQIRELLGDGEVNMASVWHAHGVALRKTGAPVEIVWNEFTMDRTYWIVSRGTPRAEFAWEFLKFALEPKNNAGFCVDGAYGPLNPAAFKYVTPEQARNMPTNPAYASGAIEFDARGMGDLMTQAERRFQRWLQQ
ncbi:polyamine ABC transporter substrate-binding protein [Cupriavidus basilensis]|uniref:polyamine ABC transporter substrate-binding protein n=1 Tax=Cupriavidus basilensis TaxID=68895 RepID=UPI0007509B5F|nr:ABC transporter substrate-binding protein [Cupriavidus basilensis]